MKKTLLLISTVILGLSSASAQITITTADVAVPTSNIYQANDTLPTITPGAAGASVTYNMTALNNHYLDTMTFLPASAAPSATFPTANLLVKQGWQAVYGYANNSATQLVMQGIGGTINIGGTLANVAQKNTPPEKLATFPFTYLSTFNNNYRTITRPFALALTVGAFTTDSARTHGSTRKTVSVDGWGTLSTPLGTYDVIRSKETKVNHDTTDVHLPLLGGFWQNAVRVTSDSTTQYSYWANSIGFTLVSVTMDSAGAVKSAQWLYQLPVGINNVAAADNSITEYPNPAQNEINIVGNTSGERTITLYDIAGRLVGTYSITNDKTTINTASYASGMYSYKITEKDGSIVKQGKVTINN